MTATLAVAEKLYTVEEYFKLDNNSEEKHEYHYGKLIKMSGEYKNANEIASNCNRQLWFALRGRGYRIFQGEVRTIVKLNKIYRYPNIVVAPVSDDSDPRHVIQPTLIIEVLSESTAKTDRREKLKEYSALPSVQYYLLIEQDERRVEMYSRDTEGWRFSIFEQPNDEINLPYLGISLSLQDIYENIHFAEQKSDS
ncbi:MAG: Uma2 family endonuclease [Saprospiraceae bacterium]|nr:Uma2 family endonuclease [Saprospiraceae bacterium]